MLRAALAPLGILLVVAAAAAYFVAYGIRLRQRAAVLHFPRPASVPARAALDGSPSGPNVSASATRPPPLTEPPSAARLVLVSFDYSLARLGNRMFQYAATLGVARRHNLPLTVMVDEAGKSNSYAQMKALFRIDASSKADSMLLQSAQKIVEPGWGLYNAALESANTFTKPVVTLTGYLQSWKYFGRDMDEIRRQYALSKQYDDATHSFLQRTLAAASRSAKATVFVGVHVRRGDMLRFPSLYTAAPAEYIGRAMKHYLDKFERSSVVMFLVATDDWPWLTEVFRSQGIGAEHFAAVRGSAEMDFAVLSRCNHSIITGGSYGWWSAFLAGGDVVYYRDFISKSSELYQSYKEEDYYLPHWIGMT